MEATLFIKNKVFFYIRSNRLSCIKIHIKLYKLKVERLERVI